MNAPLITGIGSVSPFGVTVGPIPARSVELATITTWTTHSPRKAYLVSPFRPGDVVPGMKTRRLDRLTVWSLVASSLAIKDAGIDLNQANRSRVAVVFSTALGCIELTEAYFCSAANRGWSGVDPILFPETLGSAPASHIARYHELRGPNITSSCKGLGGESALLQAASLIRNGQADCAITIAGETLTRSSYEWYEAADVLHPSCYRDAPDEGGPGIVPSEGVIAVVMESASHRVSPSPRVYARVLSGHLSAEGSVESTIQRVMPGVPSCEVTRIGSSPVADGMGDAGGLLRLALALSTAPRERIACLASQAANAASAAVLLEFA
ncbi:MAG: hypothetical protein M1570_12330 [Chloroflexi bacterium]|nr:hypothetical protein [Chloroflexota bacterium]